MNTDELLSTLIAFDARIVTGDNNSSNQCCATVRVPSEALQSVLTKLKNDPAYAFDFLLCHTAVHRQVECQIELLYRLYSTSKRHHLLVITTVPVENPRIASVSSLWRIAEWQEREVYDLFGVLYNSHPDLRRLFLEDDWKGHPLRKDYKDDFMLESP